MVGDDAVVVTAADAADIAVRPPPTIADGHAADPDAFYEAFARGVDPAPEVLWRSHFCAVFLISKIFGWKRAGCFARAL
jgi:hypothetical protein